MEKLQPCPFCGNRDVKMSTMGKFVWCPRCMATGPTAETEADAIRLWNARGTEPSAKERIKQIVSRQPSNVVYGTPEDDERFREGLRDRERARRQRVFGEKKSPAQGK